MSPHAPSHRSAFSLRSLRRAALLPSFAHARPLRGNVGIDREPLRPENRRSVVGVVKCASSSVTVDTLTADDGRGRIFGVIRFWFTVPL